MDDLYSWLSKSGCQQYHKQFTQHSVTLDLVCELDTAALKELGVSKVGDRLRLEVAIAETRREQLHQKIPLDQARQVLGAPERTPETATPTRLVTFILPDGLLKKVNVYGCFNAQLIKKKALKELGVADDDNEYDTHVHQGSGSVPGSIVALYDVEFVTICFLPERAEKHRIILTPRGEQPTAAAQEQLLRIVQRMAGRKRGTLRQFFGQRPPSEVISSNLGEYFPEAAPRALQASVRNLVLYLMRRRSLDVLVLSQRTVGDVMVHNLAIVEEALDVRDVALVLTRGSRLSLASLAGPNRYLRMEFLHMYDDSASSSGPAGAPSIASVSDTVWSSDARAGTGTGTGLETGAETLRLDSVSPASAKAEDLQESTISVGSEPLDPEPMGPGLTDSVPGAFGTRKWLQGARIGAGSFGTVYLGMDPTSGELMAVKQVQISRGPLKQNNMDRQQIEALQREMALLKDLNHENIVRYYGLSDDGTCLNIFLEYIPGGLVQTMLQLYGPFEEPLIRSFVRQVVVGLSYLHGMDIVHRDIKGANILIDIKGVAKISDFGILKKVSNDPGKQAKRALLQGLVYWMAPEVVKQTAYTKKADIWSVGCLIVEMFTGRHPFPNFSQMQAIFKIGTHTRPEIPGGCTAEAQDFLLKTLELDYAMRPDALDLLGDPFLTPLIAGPELR